MSWKQTTLQDRNRRIWDEELAGWLPQRIFDVHIHVWDDSVIPAGQTFSCAGHPIRSYPVDELSDDLASVFPGRTTAAACFGFPDVSYDLDANNRYVAEACDGRRFVPFRLLDPARDDAGRLRDDVTRRGFRGFKPYPDYVRGDLAKATIHQMLPPWAMEVADELGLAIMLHIPRPGRLADPVNQQQLVELCARYPRAKVILAHVGRAYYLKNVVGQLDRLRELPNLYYDLTMVNHWEVMAYLFQRVEGWKVLYGSDVPIALAPGKSVEINDQYTYVTPVPWKLSISDDHGKLVFTSFLYEELRAARKAAEHVGLGPDWVEGVFWTNATRLLAPPDDAQRNDS